MTMLPPTGFRVARYLPRPGVAVYAWDIPEGTPPDLEYTVWRGGAKVKTSTALVPNGNDLGLWYGETYQVTISAGDSPQSDPITVQLPAPPNALPGGVVLYLKMGFTGTPHPPTTADVDGMVYKGCDWITTVSGGLMTWVPMIQDFVLSGTIEDYQLAGFPTYIDAAKVRAEITERLDLKKLPNLWRVVMDFTGFPFKFSSGEPMWPGADDMASSNYGAGVWGSKANYQNFIHEFLHTCGLQHYGFLPSLPVNPDDLSGASPGARSDEVMGSGVLTQVTINGEEVPSLSLLNMVMLGIRKPEQVMTLPAWGGEAVITRNDLTDGSVQGVRIPLTVAGSAYIVEYRAPYVRVVLWPAMSGVQGLSLFEVATGLWPGLLFEDTLRGITISILDRNEYRVTLVIKTLVDQPAPPPPEPPPPPPPLEIISVSIVSPKSGSKITAGGTVGLMAVTTPPGLPVRWQVSRGMLLDPNDLDGFTDWAAPGKRNQSCVITATTTDGKQSAQTSEVVMTSGGAGPARKW